MTALYTAAVREAAAADVPAIVAVHAASRDHAYRELLPAHLVVPNADRSRARWAGAVAAVDVERHVLVAEVDGSIAGVAAVAPDEDGELELNALYVAPHWWRCGVGAALEQRVADLAAAAGREHLLAWVLSKNGRAKAFYFGRGWWLDGGAEIRGRSDDRYVVQRFRRVVGRPVGDGQ